MKPHFVKECFNNISLNDWCKSFVNCTHFGSLFLLVHVPAGKGPYLTKNWIPIALDLNPF